MKIIQNFLHAKAFLVQKKKFERVYYCVQTAMQEGIKLAAKKKYGHHHIKNGRRVEINQDGGNQGF